MLLRAGGATLNLKLKLPLAREKLDKTTSQSLKIPENSRFSCLLPWLNPSYDGSLAKVRDKAVIKR